MKNFIFFLFLLYSTHLFSAGKEATVDSLLTRYENKNGMGYSVVVLKNGTPVYQKSFGYFNLSKKKKISGITNFNLSSVSNQFTATAIMLLYEKGLLKFEDKVADILTDFPEYANNIQVKHLLFQTSGLPHFVQDDRNKPYFNKDVYEFLKKQKECMFKAGSRMNFNDVNYILLALIIEKVSGTSYDKFIKASIFKPLGMKKSGVYMGTKLKKIKNRAEGFIPLEPPVRNSEIDVNLTYGSGNVYTSVNDYMKFLKSIDNKTLLTDKTILYYYKMNFFQNATKYYGFGWEIAWHEGYQYFFHSGIGYGFTNYVARFPKLNVDVIFFANQASIFKVQQTVKKIAEIYSK